MNEEQIECIIDAISELSEGVNKIGDGIKSIATYLWLPIYALVIGVILVLSIYLYVSLS